MNSAAWPPYGIKMTLLVELNRGIKKKKRQTNQQMGVLHDAEETAGWPDPSEDANMVNSAKERPQQQYSAH